MVEIAALITSSTVEFRFDDEDVKGTPKYRNRITGELISIIGTEDAFAVGIRCFSFLLSIAERYMVLGFL